MLLNNESISPADQRLKALERCVHEASQGPYWHFICAHLIQEHQISEKEVQEELSRRQGAGGLEVATPVESANTIPETKQALAAARQAQEIIETPVSTPAAEITSAPAAANQVPETLGSGTGSSGYSFGTRPSLMQVLTSNSPERQVHEARVEDGAVDVKGEVGWRSTKPDVAWDGRSAGKPDTSWLKVLDHSHHAHPDLLKGKALVPRYLMYGIALLTGLIILDTAARSQPQNMPLVCFLSILSYLCFLSNASENRWAQAISQLYRTGNWETAAIYIDSSCLEKGSGKPVLTRVWLCCPHAPTPNGELLSVVAPAAQKWLFAESKYEARICHDGRLKMAVIELSSGQRFWCRSAQGTVKISARS